MSQTASGASTLRGTPAEHLFGELVSLGVRLWEEDGKLRFRAPAGILTDQRRAKLKEHRDAVLDLLRQASAPVATADPEHRHEPFPLTDVQSAYLLGRGSAFAYGGVGCHGYGELEFADLDTARLQAAWNQLIHRHEMLRAVLDTEGLQRVLPEVPEYQIQVTDVSDAEVAEAVARTRADIDHTVYRSDQWPLFTLQATRSPGRAVLHFSIDFLICDFVSIQILLNELSGLYQSPAAELSPLQISFRDYLQAERATRSGPRYQADRDYWLARVDEQPPAPELPLRTSAANAPPRFRRHALTLTPAEWESLRGRAGRHGVTPSGAVLAAYSEVIAAWSRQPAFTVNVTLLNRMPLHPQVNGLVGDFTSVNLLAVRHTPDATFRERAAALQASLWDGLDHRLFSGVETVRELARRRGGAAALMPVVFTSAIGLGDAGQATAAGLAGLGYGISQTPQVWIDCQNIERDGGLSTNWDVREGVFPDGVTEDMFAAYTVLLRQLAASDGPWEAVAPAGLPEAQARRRAEVNATSAPVPDGLLHEGILARALETPDAPVVVAPDTTLTYGGLTSRASGVMQKLLASGCASGELVAVVADKGWQQVVAVLGTLMAGGAYVPVDTSQPVARRDAILAAAGVRLVLTSDALASGPWPSSCEVIAVDGLAAGAPHRLPERRASPSDLAYVIHTSGSTGTPKGVMVSHRAALNTVRDIDSRFGAGPRDCVLGLANLGFDLSVYDIFGPPAHGGRLVLPDPRRRADPTHWASLITEHGVTLWNSVPAQLQILSDYLHAVPELGLPSLRLAMVSGDWVPVNLPGQIRARVPGLELISLGGATEAAIWSIYHPIREVDPDRPSIPYGTPLLNQTMHVLDAGLRPRPDWVTGEIYIGGVGLAEGYLHDPDRTAGRFVTGPGGQRLYRTGDLGRYWPDGSIEFLGREDFQVKIRGHRIELAEVEAALSSHPAVGACAVVVAGEPPLDRRLEGFAEPAHQPAPSLPPLGGVAATVAAGLLSQADQPEYRAYLAELDGIAVRGMLATFQQAGLFLDPAATHTLEEVYLKVSVADRHRRLARRFLRALVTEGLLAGDGEDYRLAGEAAEVDPRGEWARARELAAMAGQDDEELLGYFQAAAQRVPVLLRGEEDAARLLFPGGRLDRSDALYSGTLFNRWAAQTVAGLIQAIVRPGTDRILEVGAGAGGTTAEVLAALDSTPVDYLCTDLSSFFLDEARDRFAHRDDIRFGQFDLDSDVRSQGLAPNSADIVVAGDVLHATADMPATLARIREVLAPGGWLVFTEMTRDHYQIMASLEFLVRLDTAAGDFLDFRRGTDRTFLDEQEWRACLAAAGAEVAACQQLPSAGICVFAARFKADRVTVRPADLLGHVGSCLPAAMVPAGIQVVDALPRTGNGKLDRAVLNQWLQAAPAAPSGGEAPRTALECQLAAIWAEVLGVEQVGRDQNFFDLRGDSLQAAKLAGRLIEEVPAAAAAFFDEVLRHVLERPTVADLAAWLADPGAAEAGDAAPAADEAVSAGLVPLGGLGEHCYVLMHDATGGLTGHPALLGALREQGAVWGVPGEPLAARLDAPPHQLIAEVVADVVGMAPRSGPLHVAAYRGGGVLALELARQLAETGAEVSGLTVVDPLAGAGLPDDIGDWFRAESGGDSPEPGDPDQRLAGLHAVLAAAQELPEVYAGDVTLVLPAEDLPGQPDPVAWWRDACLGEVRVHRLGEVTADAVVRVMTGG
ncbi:MAG TPA: amino acid adenylation domain-containing protein [Streptosporangiaceae bacterium]|nr:amino acid adenylation domain-containing protein [Streptosporangiaceae bacterium]